MGNNVQRAELTYRELEPWAVGIAHGYHPTDLLTMEDLEQIARIELWKSCQAFKEERGVPIKPFARRRIVWAIIEQYRVHAPISKHFWRRGEEAPEVDSLDSMRCDPPFMDPGYARVEWNDAMDVLLTPFQRAVVQSAINGYGGAEVARIFQKHQPAVSAAHRRARGRLLPLVLA